MHSFWGGVPKICDSYKMDKQPVCTHQLPSWLQLWTNSDLIGLVHVLDIYVTAAKGFKNYLHKLGSRWCWNIIWLLYARLTTYQWTLVSNNIIEVFPPKSFKTQNKQSIPLLIWPNLSILLWSPFLCFPLYFLPSSSSSSFLSSLSSVLCSLALSGGCCLHVLGMADRPDPFTKHSSRSHTTRFWLAVYSHASLYIPSAFPSLFNSCISNLLTDFN